MASSQKQLTILGLQALGLVEQHGASSRYRVFESDGTYLKEGRFLIGKNGAFRFTAGPIDRSSSWTNAKMHRAIAFVGKRVEARANPGVLDPMTPGLAHRILLRYMNPQV